MSANPENLVTGPLAESAFPAQIEVRRSPKRQRTVSARREGPKTVVFIPARFTAEEEQQWVAEMVERLDASDRRTGSGTRRSDIALLERAHEMSLRYLEGKAVPDSVRWVANQHQRWGSCTPEDGSIRLSNRLQSMPAYVVDFVLLHELAHLIEPGHGGEFHSLLSGFDLADKAQGYLDGFAAGHLIGAAAGTPSANEQPLTEGDGPRPSDQRAPNPPPAPRIQDRTPEKPPEVPVVPPRPTRRPEALTRRPEALTRRPEAMVLQPVGQSPPTPRRRRCGDGHWTNGSGLVGTTPGEQPGC